MNISLPPSANLSANDDAADADARDEWIAAFQAGEPTPLGATWTDEGINFAIFSSGADQLHLCLFDETAAVERMRLPLPARTGDVWHGLLPIPYARPGMIYGYRAAGPYEPERGLRYNANKLLLDPYARALAGSWHWHPALKGAVLSEDRTGDRPDPQDSAPYTHKCVVTSPGFDWDEDRPPAVPWRETIIYELHVRGFTKLHPQIPENLRGTYLGLAHPAATSYLRRLGVTAVELMPVQAFVDEQFLADKKLHNYWGYNSIAWFAPALQYAVTDAVTEFKTMVRALHAEGLEVIIDVVLNHTAEGNEQGPTISLRGLDNPAYYWLEPSNPRRYHDRTGCGNTVGIAHPATQQLLIDSLKYWVEEMHVDGFRFDLAAVLGREDGHFRPDGAFFKALKAEPALRYIKLIAEPWDVGPDGYQLSRFPPGWSEWNDLYRDTVRGFWRGNPGILGNFAERFAGSSDLFRQHGRRPTAGVNFVTCHDGFTLRDAVSYNEKHNEANLEDNRDGHNHNLSWNCGVEGVATSPPMDPPQYRQVLALRERQTRNFLATLLLSQGVPMLLSGDEFGRSQGGNNNAYCQDNEISWLDWQLSETNASLVRFVRQLIALRQQAPGLRRDTFLKGSVQPDRQRKDVSWCRPDGREMESGDWQNPEGRSLGVLIGHAFVDLHGNASGHLLYLCNASDRQLSFQLPRPQVGMQWFAMFDTARTERTEGREQIVATDVYLLEAHSSVLLADGMYDRRLEPRRTSPEPL